MNDYDYYAKESLWEDKTVQQVSVIVLIHRTTFEENKCIMLVAI